MKASIAERIQAALLQENLNGWLFDSFRGSDPISENILQLDALPGEMKVYLPWQQIHSHSVDILSGSRRVAMQYSPLNATSASPNTGLSHSAELHFQPNREHHRNMNEGDFLLMDIWAQKRVAHSVYDDITRTGYIGDSVSTAARPYFRL